MYPRQQSNSTSEKKGNEKERTASLSEFCKLTEEEKIKEYKKLDDKYMKTLEECVGCNHRKYALMHLERRTEWMR